jgi:putative membrane-bound dehydrogenase-like protein
MPRGLLALALLLPGFPLLAAEPTSKEKNNEGVLPVGADGKPLNLDFETGTLKDWTTEGDAFKDQPIKGDTVSPRRGDMHSRHQGDYWIGGYEKHGDKPTGTLTSIPFRVTHPWASFLVGGGSHADTRVEVALAPGGEVIYRTSGLDEEDMKRVAVDLTRYMGKEILIRLVDRESGGWGHINFDDFRFHSEKPTFPVRPAQVLKPDEYKYSGLPPEKAAAAMTVPEGFTVTLFAGEPDVQQPVAFTIDDRGRLWVVEAYIYPKRLPFPGPVLPEAEKAKGDKILIFEDTDGDGKFDKKTVFMEGMNLVSGLEVGFGGVWVGAAPYLLFIPHDPKTDKPAGPPQILLDGWHYEDTHETLNTFTWGPDGWLYGCHGVFTHSLVGKPGTPDEDRVPINAGVWRYHPTKHIFEVFAHGTSNPWGLDYNAVGDFFIEACVIPHLYHIIQGGRYERQAGQHFNPYTYADIQTIADHRHYVGPNPHGGNNKSDSAGGGHAHCGLMCYLGGAWPQEYRGQLFMGNIHGRRINMDIPKSKGSGYVASHGKDFLLANDEWARFINLKYGPDGNVYLIDWYDKQACHRPEPEIWDRTNGRVYKISYRGSKAVTGIDLSKKTDAELVELQLDKNEWYVRHARRLLQERAAAEKLDPKAREALAKIAFENDSDTRALRGLWSLDATGGLNEAQVLEGLRRSSTRGWTIQLALEDGKVSDAVLKKLVEIAHSTSNSAERLYLAAALQRLPLDQRWDIAEGLLLMPEEASDHNLPLMYWYGVEPLAEKDPGRALALAIDAKLGSILPFMVRRIASAGTPEALDLLVAALGRARYGIEGTILRGVNEALKGRRQVAKPAGWDAAFARVMERASDPEVRSQALSLAVTFGDPKAFAELRGVVQSATANLSQRQNALSALLGAKDKELPPVLRKLVGEPALRAAAIRGLALYDDPDSPKVLLSVYGSLSSAEKRDVLNTLAARPAYAKALLDAMAAKQVPAADVSADVVRQLRNLKDADLEKRIGEVWGTIRSTPADRLKLIAQYRKMLTAPYQGAPDLALGRAMFVKTCSQCHTLFGVGGKVGPDITGSNRINLDYLLENILDPSAVIPKDYAATKVELTDGRVVTGIVKAQDGTSVTVVTANETLVIPRSEIDSLKPSELSMMPDDLLKPLGDREVRSLIAYLQSPQQTPILVTEENAKDFFNGKDLAGWDGDAKLWSVENGEIVGKSPGIKRNEFLKSHMTAEDFRLTLKVKLVPNKENSGVQFRSEALPDGEMKGYQADIGEGWWGKLYEENGRAVLSDNKSGQGVVKKDDWNEYEIVAVGSRIKTFLNGKPCVDLDDPKGAKRGIFALQIHSGGPMEVRFKELKLEVKPKIRLDSR